MNEVIYNGECVELDTNIAKALIKEYQETVWKALAKGRCDCEAVEILSRKLEENGILGQVDDYDLEMLYVKLDLLEEAIERAKKNAYVNKLKREIRSLCEITGDNPDIEADFSDPG